MKAFPHDNSNISKNEMNLRDYFAIRVTQGLMSNEGCNTTGYAELVDVGYKVADEMMERRKKQ